MSHHPGYLGGLDKAGAHGKVSPYFATYSSETIFHVATLMPDLESKKSVILKDYVLVLWMEDEFDQANIIESVFKSAGCLILIHPLVNGLFQVKVIGREEVSLLLGKLIKQTSHPGPLVDNVLVRKELLAPLVRITAMNAYGDVRSVREGTVKPYQVRKKLIEELGARFRKDENITNFFASTFTTSRATTSTSSSHPIQNPRASAKWSNMPSKPSSPLSSSPRVIGGSFRKN